MCHWWRFCSSAMAPNIKKIKSDSRERPSALLSYSKRTSTFVVYSRDLIEWRSFSEYHSIRSRWLFSSWRYLTTSVLSIVKIVFCVEQERMTECMKKFSFQMRKRHFQSSFFLFLSSFRLLSNWLLVKIRNVTLSSSSLDCLLVYNDYDRIWINLKREKMSYESTKTSSNLGASETMASDMPSQANNTNFYTNNTNRNQVMMMNPMVNTGNYYNGPPPGAAQSAAGQPAQSANRPMYQSYPPSAAPHPPHHQPSQPGGQPHQIVSLERCRFSPFSFSPTNEKKKRNEKKKISLRWIET